MLTGTRRKQLAILELFGTLDFDDRYDASRNRKLDKVPQDQPE